MEQQARRAVWPFRSPNIWAHRKVVATGRNAEALRALSVLGADVTIPLGDGGDAFEDALKEQFGGDGIDVGLDYLLGQSAERIIIAGAKAGERSEEHTS